MAQFYTDKYLKYKAALEGKPIEDDRPCEHCGYNLRGLRFGTVCPECGTPIRHRRHSDLAFHEMPVPLIRGFRLSCWMAAGAIAGLVGLAFLGAFKLDHWVGFTLVAAMTALWLAAVWRFTQPLDVPQAGAYGFSPRGRLRNAARWLQLGWPTALGAAGCSRMLAGAPVMASWLDRAVVIGLLVGVVGLGALAVLMARFAEWVRDETAGKAFQFAVWGTCFLGVLALFLPLVKSTIGGFTIFFIPLGAILVVVLLVAAIAAFPFGLFCLSRSVDWSLVHARERADRDRRLHERMAPRPAPLPGGSSDEPIGLADPDPDAPPRPIVPEP